MNPRSPLRFFVGSALLVAPLPACGPDQAEEVPIRTNVGREEPEEITNVGRVTEEPEPEPTVNVEPEATPEPEEVPAEAPEDPSANPAADPLVNPSSGERIEVVAPDAPYHPTKTTKAP